MVCCRSPIKKIHIECLYVYRIKDRADGTIERLNIIIMHYYKNTYNHG